MRDRIWRAVRAEGARVGLRILSAWRRPCLRYALAMWRCARARDRGRDIAAAWWSWRARVWEARLKQDVGDGLCDVVCDALARLELPHATD